MKITNKLQILVVILSIASSLGQLKVNPPSGSSSFPPLPKAQDPAKPTDPTKCPCSERGKGNYLQGWTCPNWYLNDKVVGTNCWFNPSVVDSNAKSFGGELGMEINCETMTDDLKPFLIDNPDTKSKNKILPYKNISIDYNISGISDPRKDYESPKLTGKLFCDDQYGKANKFTWELPYKCGEDKAPLDLVRKFIENLKSLKIRQKIDIIGNKKEISNAVSKFVTGSLECDKVAAAKDNAAKLIEENNKKKADLLKKRDDDAAIIQQKVKEVDDTKKALDDVYIPKRQDLESNIKTKNDLIKTNQEAVINAINGAKKSFEEIKNDLDRTMNDLKAQLAAVNLLMPGGDNNTRLTGIFNDMINAINLNIKNIATPGQILFSSTDSTNFYKALKNLNPVSQPKPSK